ncbi:hypothetical protein EST38_g8660 [Candolleomyces aberdarensis]|uniref:RNA-directed DNA polymerase n=1 Tax=Candolleomyces aberdarensis TaxID=2316362 RepID=A0A4Q2DE27_9AGAR|nr:hypothetical protein EST38_g8660 [Candolleomyces aberdarensis]
MPPNTRRSAKAGTAEPSTNETIDVDSQGEPLLSGDDSPLTDLSGDKETVIDHPIPPVLPPIIPPHSPSNSDLSPSDSETSSDSDSDSDICPVQTKTMGNSNVATITVSGHGKRPSVSEGDLTPAILLEFAQYCRCFYDKKDIPEEKRVARPVLFCFKDVRISTYISANQSVLGALPFDTFLKRIRDNFLPHDWADNLRADIYRASQGKDQPWRDYANKVARNNALLTLSDDGALPKSRIMEQLRSNMSDHLRSKLRPITIPKTIRIGSEDVEIPLLQWTEFIARYDDDLRFELKQAREIADDVHRNAKRQNTNSTTSTSNDRRPRQAGSGTKSGHLPALTENEIKLLNEHQGCRKCREFYAGHYSKTCTGNFPSAANYAELTLTKALDAKKKQNTKATSSSTVRTAAITTLPDSDNESPLVTAAAINTVTPKRNRVHLPGRKDLLGRWDSTGQLYNDVSDPVPIENLYWDTHVFGLDEFPTPVTTMLDNGAGLILIDDTWATKLGLRRFPLRNPPTVGAAFTSNTSTVPSHFVRLSVTSVDHAWTSSVVNAVIVKNLCVPILLGLPFLVENEIVVDHAARTAVAKTSGYDLLAGLKRSPLDRLSALLAARQQNTPRKRIRQLRDDWANMLTELLQRTSHRRLALKGLSTSRCINAAIAAVNKIVRDKAAAVQRAVLEQQILNDYEDVFSPPLTVNDLPSDVHARIHLKDPNWSMPSLTYSCPRKYRDKWKELIEEHLAAGRIRPSSSPFASPSFVIPKADPAAKPRWVNDYRVLNANTVPDRYPLPRVDDIIADIARGKIFSVFDMTNAFFQTRMHPDDVELTAVSTPWGSFDWLVMPMGLRNAPSIHQQRIAQALAPFLGKFVHVYLDDIVVFSDSVEEHVHHLHAILKALRDHKLSLNPKKTCLFRDEIHFLGHVISAEGVRPDEQKVEKIKHWPPPKSATDVRRFLGLVRYLAAFLPNLAAHTEVLFRLTTKDCDAEFPQWTSEHQRAFDGIKDLVVSAECLTTIDHECPGENKIYLTTDASNTWSGAILSFGPTWESARPVAFDSAPFKGAQLHYLTHEKEMLAVMRALVKWRSDLVGESFFIYTDHRTLENFDGQKDLSGRQQRWMEYLSQFDGKFVYVKGEDNTVADALSRTELMDSSDLAEQVAAEFDLWDDRNATNCQLLATKEGSPLAATAIVRDCTSQPPNQISSLAAAVVDDRKSIRLSIDDDFIQSMIHGYTLDPWCQKLADAAVGIQNLCSRDGLWYLNDRLLVPDAPGLHETVFQLAHDALGHFGFQKAYKALRDDFYWPNMRCDLEQGYIAGCEACQRNKSPTVRPSGPLHPLPVPDSRFSLVAIDFVGPLPVDKGFDYVVTMTDRLGADIKLVPCKSTMTAPEFAEIFFDHWYCDNGLPLEIISDRDKLFTSSFWKTLHALTGVKLKMSTAFHPQTDGSSERTNKTVIQALRYHVERDQKGWVKALPKVRFDIMNAVNSSTGFSPFQLKSGFSPRVIPPFSLSDNPLPPSAELDLALSTLERLRVDVLEAQDTLHRAKINQAKSANRHRNPDPHFDVGDKVLLCTKNWRREYLAGDARRTAKFIPRFDGPYRILKAHADSSSYTLDLPVSSNIFPTFHVSQLKRFVPNDASKFPSREHSRPGPVMTPDGAEEWWIDRIIDSRRRGRGWRYLVRWRGYGPEDDEWLPGKELEDCEALDIWQKAHPQDYV